MRSTFMGLETNKRGLYTQQSALYTTGHNISNANTLGYSRQRVNMEATSGFPGVGLNSGTMPGFLGTGVQAGSVQRIRDTFVDQQFRQESNKFGYWESRSSAIEQMEDILTEPSDYGLQKSLSEFWKSLQDIATSPENEGTRRVAIQKGLAVADSFNYMHKSLTEIQTNIGKEIDVSTTDINSILQQIADLNRQIAEVEPNGYLPNDLYDARDLLIDELSLYVPIETSYEKSGGRALAVAEGSVIITLKTANGPIELVKGGSAGTFETTNSLVGPNKENVPIEGLTIRGADGTVTDINHDELLNQGKLKSLMNAYGTKTGNTVSGIYPDMLAELDRMARAFAKAMNDIHKEGTDLNGEQGEDFFSIMDPNATEFTAGNITVSKELLDDPSKLAASDSDPGDPEVGNGKNAQRLADVHSMALPGQDGLDGATVETFFQGLIGKLGVEGEQAAKLTLNTATLLGAVEHRRASISSVSLDEEMTDMIRFQQAYNASARMITVVDETLDKIINGMGVVGR